MSLSDKDERFYYDLNNHSIDDLIFKLENGGANFSLEKMIEKGLAPDKEEALRSRIGELEDDAAKKDREEQIQFRSLQDDNDRKQQVIDFCNRIADDQMTLEQIKIDIINGVFSYDDMGKHLSESNLSSEKFNKIGYYISNKKQVDFYLWKDLPPLLDERTDIYFFGQPASGKSCILANLFSYIDKKGLIIENTHSLVGTGYKNTIQYEYDLGYLPERTGSSPDGVNYITFELANPDRQDQKHPLNFIEMSGELFDQATTDGVSGNNLNAKNYLNNGNRKLLFFVVDYDRHVQATLNPDGNTPQGSKMLTILSLLDQFGTFKQTDAIYILVSKADLFPQGENPLTFTENFLNENYMAFLNNCKEIRRKYRGNFDIKGYPFSIGNLIFKSSYVIERDYNWSGKIVDEILSKSFIKKGKTGVFGFFK